MGRLVRTAAQQEFAATLRRLAAQPDDVAVFEAEEAALKWLGIDPARAQRDQM